MPKKSAIPKVYTTVHISPEAKRLMTELSLKLCISRSAVLEIAIRDKAKQEGLKQT